MNLSPTHVVIKLGGSLITHKDQPYTLDEVSLVACSKYVAQWVGKARHVLVIHGAGSYGHVPAQQLKDNWLRMSLKERGEAVIKVQQSVSALHAFVCQSLEEQGLHPYGTLARTASDTSSFVNNLVSCAQKGYMVVTGGDLRLLKDTYQIISGDILMEYIVRTLSLLPGVNVRAVFLTRTGGVVNSHGQVMPRLEPQDTITKLSMPYADVSGGMVEKVAIARRIAALGAQVYITTPFATQGGSGTQVLSEN